MTCPICQEIENKENIIYEDKICAALLHPIPSVKGHILVAPKEHHPILEQTPDEIVEHCFFVANKASILVFETLGVHGTNITINNGLPAGQEIPHFTINILPRSENDGIDFNFERQQAKPEQLKEVQEKLKDCAILIGHEKPETKIISEDEPDEIISEDGKDNYLIKQLRRIP